MVDLPANFKLDVIQKYLLSLFFLYIKKRVFLSCGGFHFFFPLAENCEN